MNQQLEWTFLLLVIYQLKHFVADFPLQREYMLRKVRPGWDFILPLAMHCGVHAIGTLIVVFLTNPALWWLAIFDFVVHFVIDRVKASPVYLGRFNDLTKAGFWNVLGLDQMAHHLTHILIVWWIISHTTL